ncbi:hypothetical protein BC827DRAFT_1277565 [Russula dissimulans]|nr:hypothetical protein BC827DRAFT_1277565 [Russula dissimulans]
MNERMNFPSPRYLSSLPPHIACPEVYCCAWFIAGASVSVNYIDPEEPQPWFRTWTSSTRGGTSLEPAKAHISVRRQVTVLVTEVRQTRVTQCKPCFGKGGGIALPPNLHAYKIDEDEGFVSTHHYPTAGSSLAAPLTRRSHPSEKVHEQRHDPKRNVDACTKSYVTLCAYDDPRWRAKQVPPKQTHTYTMTHLNGGVSTFSFTDQWRISCRFSTLDQRSRPSNPSRAENSASRPLFVRLSAVWQAGTRYSAPAPKHADAAGPKDVLKAREIAPQSAAEGAAASDEIQKDIVSASAISVTKRTEEKTVACVALRMGGWGWLGESRARVKKVHVSALRIIDTTAVIEILPHEVYDTVSSLRMTRKGRRAEGQGTARAELVALPRPGLGAARMLRRRLFCGGWGSLDDGGSEKKRRRALGENRNEERTDGQRDEQRTKKKKTAEPKARGKKNNLGDAGERGSAGVSCRVVVHLFAPEPVNACAITEGAT